MAAESSTDDVYNGQTVMIRRPQAAGPGAVAAAGSALTVFLSSTIKDLEDYRREAQDAMMNTARVACFLSEDWVNTYGFTEQICRENLEKSDGFIGIFAYYYGSIPTNSDRSITHQEYTWALAKWAEKSPRIAILMPEIPSEAARLLKKKAAKLIGKKSAVQKAHAKQLKKFHQEVTQGWRPVNWFKNEQKLREKIIYVCTRWTYGDPMDAANGLVEVVNKTAGVRVPLDEELGLLGREPQLRAFEKILARIDFFPTVPAAAILVHGAEDAGQDVLLKQLVTSKKLRAGRPVQMGRPQLPQYNLKALVQWVGESVGVLAKSKEVTTLDDLADLIHQELANQQLSFVLDDVYRMAGGVTAWQRDFWQPLFTRLTTLRKQRPTPHRLIGVVVDYQDRSKLDATVAAPFTQATTEPDFGHLLSLPPLEDITAGDFIDWLDHLEVPNGAGNRRVALTDDALTARGGGADGNPLRVYNRLKRRHLWDAEDMP